MSTDKTAELQSEYESLWIEWLALELDDPEGDEIMDRISEMESVLGFEKSMRSFKWETVLDPGPNYRGPDRTPSGQPVHVQYDSTKWAPPKTGSQIMEDIASGRMTLKSGVEPSIKPRARPHLKLVR